METKSRVRLAQPSDEPELLHLFRMMHAEGGMRKLDIDRVRQTFARAFDRKGGIIAVIGAPGHIRAMMYLLVTQYFYTSENHIEELWNWVHPDHRSSDYAKTLLEYSKECSDRMSSDMGEKIPLLIGVLTNRRMEAKVRLYRRIFGAPYGAVFLHNASWIAKDDLSSEDFWHVPKLSKAHFKREDRRAVTRDDRRMRA